MLETVESGLGIMSKVSRDEARQIMNCAIVILTICGYCYCVLVHLLCTFPNLEAYDPVINEWKMMMVSSRSQMKTRSKFDSGSGDGLGALRFLFRALLDPPVKGHTKFIKDHVHYLK